MMIFCANGVPKMADAMDFIANFDWITPLVATVQDVLNRPSTGFNIPASDNTPSAFEVRDYLARSGVKTWGWQKVGDVIGFRCRAAQGEYVDHLLAQLGIGIAGVDPRLPKWRKAKRQAKRKRKRKQPGVKDVLLDWLGV